MKRLLAILFLSVLLVPAALAAEPESDAPAPRKQRPKVGLVLSGGGAKGMSHIGALKVIEELGIPVDYVVGTSIGSIMAGFYALGYKADELDSLVRSQDWDLLMKDQIKRRNIYSADKDDQDRFLVTFPFMNNKTLMEETQANREKRDKGVLRNMPSALVSGHNLDQLFTKLSVGYQDDIDFNTLPIPFACVAVDLNTKEEVVFHSGNIVTAIRSSMSIPGYFAPVPYGDRFLVDGGMLNNLPVDVVKKMGADYVITVDLHHFKKDRPDTDQTIPEMISTMLSIMNGEKYQAGREASDIIIEPNTSAYGVLAFDDKSVDALVDSGLVAANRVRPQLESLARHLKEYPADNTPRPPKAIDLNRDSVLISQMEIQGADARDMSWLMSKTEIGPGKYVTGEDMDKAISFCYNTKCFRKINYSIAGKEGDYRLKINFSPQRLHQAGIGFRFDSEEMAAILLGISLNKYRMFGPKLDMKLELSANPELTVTAGYTFHNLTRFNFSVNALNTKFDIYDNVTSYITETEGYSLSDTDRYKMLNAQADYRIVGWKNTDLTFGAKFTYYSILNVDATPEGFNLGEETTSHGWEGFINWHFDNMDASEFARHGLQFNLRGGAEYDYGMTFFDTRFDLKAAIPLSASVTLVPQLYNRWIFGAELKAYQNIVGGYVAGRYLPWQLPFVGINHTYRPTGKVNIARADVRVNLFGQHYLTFIGNYMGEWEFLRFEDGGKLFQGHFGAGAAYSINTIIGPIQACVHWSNLSKSVGFYFCLGHQF